MSVFRFPLVRLSLFFVLGIYISQQFTVSFEIALFIGAFLFLILLAVHGYNSTKTKSPYLFSLVMAALAFNCGLMTTAAHNPKAAATHYVNLQNLEEKPQLLKLQIREKLKPNQYAQRYICQVSQLDGKSASGKILLSIKDSSSKRKVWVSGSILLVKEVLIKNKPPKNPAQFDYGNYLNQKGIYSQVYAEASHIKLIGTQTDLWHHADALRQKILDNLQKSNFSPQIQPVLAALILGQQQDISREILQDYQYAGAVHILSVSGLHVGFILLFLNFLLRWLPKNTSGQIIRLAIILIGLWGFSFLAGLSPSVVRSAAMFSFLAIGLCLKRQPDMMYTLCISMLLILAISPHFLLDIGFQLSYLALFFILWLQPLLQKIYKPKNKIARYFWEIVTVSFAAQIGTFPLSLYYFHQFPGLFFVTNLVVIPMLTLIMAAGTLTVIWAGCSTVPYSLVWITQKSIELMNSIIAHVASLESFVFQSIPFDKSMLLLSYLAMALLILWWKKPTYPKILAGLFTVIAFQLSCFYSMYSKEIQSELIVFNVSKQSLIVERIGKKCTIRTTIQKDDKLKWLLDPYLIANFSKTQRQLPIGNVFTFSDKKIMRIDSSGVYPDKAKPDIVLLTQSAKINLERMLIDLQPALIIADASNYKSTVRQWELSCRKQKIPFHATAEKGSYTISSND